MTTLEIVGGQVLRPDMTVEHADVLADRKTGEIRAVGDVPAGDESLDASGGLVIPGLVNAHTHVAMTLLRGYADDEPLETWLQEDVWPVEATLEPADVRAGVELGLVEMIETGTTGFCDMYFDVAETVAAVEEAGLRARVGHGIVTVGKNGDEARADFEEGLRVAREFDGAADGRISTAFMPHSLTTVDADELDEFVPEAREAGVPVHLHANETTGEVEPIVDEHGKRPLEYAVDHGLLEPEDFVAHGVHVDEREVDLLAERGAGVVHCPASNMKLASGIAPVQDLLDAGVTVGLGTDGAASNNDLDMFNELRDAAMVGKLAADDASAVDAPNAVGMATAGSAAVAGFDSGRIEAGANADLAVLDLDATHFTPHHDLVSHLAYAASGTDVRHTVCDGEVLMRDREVLTLDVDEVRETAERHAAAVVERAE
ncbi:amidohydrolase [Halococcus sp. IIIV-5B]|uniref:amidohydrolase n=1 Tax=Halococcus sp. IIIV-5B TaxID=2321230 RepID=UPI000E718E09|nr:amidohydrolase [Halococcus sp. IIIV-5B]RJS95811.1 amidohydrolase [Halococcus sp. IIIV-5B]